MKVLVTGVEGQLGYDVCRVLSERGIDHWGTDIDDFDITDAAATKKSIETYRPDAVIHCAAWTNVDGAEDEENLTKVRAVNVEGTGNIAQVCKTLGCKMLYISTDYVFDGQGTEPWKPECKDYRPLNVYGQTKLEGELAVSGLLEKYFIVRTAWVFGQNGKNFVKTMLNVAKKHDTVRVVNDQIGTPTFTPDLARLLCDMIVTDKYGYYHATNEGGFISWYDFTCEIYRQAELDVRVIPVSTAEYGLSKAKRPMNSRLDKSKLSENGFERLPDWRDALSRYLTCAKNEELETLRQRLEERERENTKLRRQLEVTKKALQHSQAQFNEISNAAFWKMTRPMRATLDVLKKTPQIICAIPAGMRLVPKGIKSLKDMGWSYTWNKAKLKLFQQNQAAVIAKQHLFTHSELEEQKKAVFPRKITFSIVVPLYNTPERFLREMIQSVLDQTYERWELCMADGSDAEHSYVERICREYAHSDSRIHYKKLDKNLGISGNTNACLEMAQGDYIGLFDHDDLLHPAALHEVMKAICELDADFVYTDEGIFHTAPSDAFFFHFKPDFAPDNLRANNYICHFTVFQKSLLEQVGGFNPECDGSQDHDMVLRLTERAKRVAHIPEVLYYWRANPGSVADDITSKPYVFRSGIRSVERQLKRLGIRGEVDTVLPNHSIYTIRYEIQGQPRISILIPNFEHLSNLRTCLDSIFEKTTYPNYEIVIVGNNSSSPALFAYYEQLQKEHRNLRVVTWEGKFNYSAINNYGAQFCSGEYLLLLNNDTEVISPDWLQEMLMYAHRQDVGAVGAKLYYPDNTIQHGGVILGLGGVGGHAHRLLSGQSPGYMGRLLYAQNLSAVSGACMLLRRDVWEAVNGLDESFAAAFNDVDLCMRIRRAGYLIVWTPFAELYHYESKSRGLDTTPEKRKRFQEEVLHFQERWAKELADGDPYYNPNFSLKREDFGFAPVVRQHKARLK